MAVFVCAADESADSGNFFYGGFAAPVDDWDGTFATAWNERVLNGPPQIPYLHMTDIRDWDWQRRYGLSQREANNRIDEAARVIRSTGSLTPVCFSVDRDEYTSILRQRINPRPGQIIMLEPDYMCFLWFAFTELEWLYSAHGDAVEKVDFWVEENGKITRHMQHFNGQLADALNFMGRPHLAGLVGKLRPVEKEAIPAQAADMLGWHARNAARKALDRDGYRRYWKMTTGDIPGSIRGRFGHRGTVDADELRLLAVGLAAEDAGTEGSVDGGAA